MGTIPESIPYEEFLELRKEVDKVRCSLNLALRILGGLAGFADEQITLELHKEFDQKNDDTNIKVLLPKITNTFVEGVNYAIEESKTDPLEGTVDKPTSRTIIKVSAAKPTPLQKKTVNLRKRKTQDYRNNKGKKPLIIPVDIQTLLPASTTSNNPVSSSSLSEIDKECMETNQILHRLINNEVSIDVEAVKLEPEGLTEPELVINDTQVLHGLQSTVTSPNQPTKQERRGRPRKQLLEKKTCLATDNIAWGDTEYAGISSDKQEHTTADPENKCVIAKSATKDGKRIWNRTDCCIFCNELVTNFTRHLTRRHKNELAVAKILGKPKGCKERKVMFEKLKKKGNFFHNTKCIRENSGSVIVAHRPQSEAEVSKFLPCEHCLGFFSRSVLYRHMRTCISRETGHSSKHAQSVGS